MGKVSDVDNSDSDTRTPPLRWALRAVPLLLLALVIGLTVALAGAEDEDPGPRALAGDVIEGRRDFLESLQFTDLYLPWARIEVGAGPAHAELPDHLGARPNVRAPEGGSFVPVAVRFGENLEFGALGPHFDTRAHLTLRAGGKSYPVLSDRDAVLRPFEGGAGSMVWVAVDGHPEDLEVRLTVSNETHVMDAVTGDVTLGRAAVFEDVPVADEAPDFEPVPCPAFRPTRSTPMRITDAGYDSDYDRCRVVHTARLPYVDGLGWAEEGREFLLVQLEPPFRIEVQTPGDGPDDEWDTAVRLHGRVDGRKDLAAVGDAVIVGSPARRVVTLVFGVPRDSPVEELTVLAHVTAYPALDPFVERRPTGVFAARIPGRKLS